MATPVELPKSGNTVEECVIGRWVKQVGDAVSAGDVLAEVETDKATFEITAPVGGTLLATFFPEGALVPVFTTVCVIGEPGEAVASPEPVAPTAVSASLQPLAPTARASHTASPEPPSQSARASGHLSPRARRFAAERGFELTAIVGSGPGGRVLEQDVRTAYESARAAAATPATLARPLASRDVTAHQRRESPAVT